MQLQGCLQQLSKQVTEPNNQPMQVKPTNNRGKLAPKALSEQSAPRNLEAASKCHTHENYMYSTNVNQSNLTDSQLSFPDPTLFC